MFKDTKVLVTGGCSFIGSNLVESLLNDGARVTVVDDLSSGTLDNLSEVISKVEFIEGDLRNFSVADRASKNQDMTFHLANIHGGRGFIETHPAEISQNLIIDGNVFRAAFLNHVDRVCYTSSACVYPVNLQSADSMKDYRFLKEDMADPFKQGAALADGEYGWAKLMGEMTLHAYHKQFGLKGVSCRLFTVYGPRENESHAIIAFIAKALVRQDPFEVWGSGEQDRNFTFVSDVVEGIKRAAAKITDCRAVNIGTDEIIKIKDAARVVCELVGHNPFEFYFDRTKPEGVFARAASVENQKRWLDWQPKVKFNDGIADTVRWYLKSKPKEVASNAILNKLFDR